MPEFTIPTHKAARHALAARLAAAGHITREACERRLLRGCKTLRCQPDKESDWLRVKSGWPDYVRDLLDQSALNEQLNMPRPFRPTPADMSDFLTALAWLGPLDKKQRRIVWLKSADFAWVDIGDRLAVSGSTAAYHYKNAITNAWMVASLRIERGVDAPVDDATQKTG